MQWGGRVVNIYVYTCTDITNFVDTIVVLLFFIITASMVNDLKMFWLSYPDS